MYGGTRSGKVAGAAEIIMEINFRVKKIIKISDNIHYYLLDLITPQEIDFKAGQFINILVEANFYRPYSIFSPPSAKKQLEFFVDISPGGKGSKYFEKLKEGDEVFGTGPFGTFTTSETDKEIIFIATGSGIAPIRCMIRDLLQKEDKRKMTLFFGVRYKTDNYLFKEFEKDTRENDNFKFYGTVSRPDSQWQGLSGRVTEHLGKIGDYQNKDYYLCGAPKTIDALKIYLTTCGVKEEKIHYEQY